MKLIAELNEQASAQILESEEGNRDYFIEGVFLQAEKKNKNKRVYPKDVLEKEINRYISENINQNRGMGELGHPDGPEINLDRVSHKIVEINQSNNDFYGKAKIMDTPNGQIVKNLIDENVTFGVSSRGLGSLKEQNGANYVQEDFYLATPADIVANPSAPDAFVNGIMEGAEWIYENGKLRKIEDPEQWIEESQKQILRVPKSQIEEMKIRKLKEFIESL